MTPPKAPPPTVQDSDRRSARETRRWRLVRAPGEAIPASVRRFNQRARARRVAAARPWALVALALIAAGGLAWLILVSSVFGVASIKVSGSGFVGSAAIRQAAGVRLGTPLATLDTGAIATRIRKLAPVANVQVSRDIPRTLLIRVTLRQPVAAVAIGNNHQYVQVDATGVGFRTVSTPDHLPVIRPGDGTPVDLTQDGVRAALTAAAEILVALPAELTDQLLRVDAPSSTGVVLVLTDDRKIIWGDSSDNDQKARVAESLLAQPGKVIDVSAPTVVTVR
jgi:cell division protein FtsQ